MRSFQHQFFPKSEGKGRYTKAFGYIAAKMSEYEWLHTPSVSMLRLASQLAWGGHLTSLENMELLDMDISPISCDQIGKLASIVTDKVEIYLLTPITHLDMILENARCRRLELSCMTLTELQTRALVRAMQDRVGSVKMFGVTLDLETLCQYKGQGRCSYITVEADSRTLYGERIMNWMTQVGWSVLKDTDWELTVWLENKFVS